jgi:hypothetical protein
MASEPPTRSPIAGGFLLAACLLVGAVAGTLAGQPSLGVVIGLGVGLLLAAGVWLYERQRRG